MFTHAASCVPVNVQCRGASITYCIMTLGRLGAVLMGDENYIE